MALATLRVVVCSSEQSRFANNNYSMPQWTAFSLALATLKVVVCSSEQPRFANNTCFGYTVTYGVPQVLVGLNSIAKIQVVLFAEGCHV